MKTLLATILAFCTFVVVAANASPQSATKTFYIFAGASRNDGVTDNASRKKSESFEQANAIAVADRVACALTRSVAISGVLGIYPQAFANSILTKVTLKRAEMEYLGSLLGQYEHMKYVLVFSREPGGHDRLWVINTTRSLDSVEAAVRRQHLTPLSVRIEKSAIQIWLVDRGDRFGLQPKDLATELGGRASSEDGSSEIVGDQTDRAGAEAAYLSTIQAFEQRSKLHFSSSVKTAAWQKASARTCSVELPE